MLAAQGLAFQLRMTEMGEIGSSKAVFMRASIRGHHVFPARRSLPRSPKTGGKQWNGCIRFNGQGNHRFPLFFQMGNTSLQTDNCRSAGRPRTRMTMRRIRVLFRSEPALP
jgi:hypothetical protein